MRKTVLATLLLGVSSLLAAQQALNNDSVIKMAKAGLSDEVIIATVNSQPGQYDTSVNGLLEFKQGGVSDKVVAAVISKASGVTATPAPAPAISGTSALPPGIDEIGVYYKEKSGKWTALMPEVVNFKSGGFMKSIATQGIVKGDVNGHIEGKAAKTQVTFPVVFAIYAPEGTAATEYQLVRLRQQSNSREFRSTTGGVFHSSGGAKRDLIEFKAEKIAPRLYQFSIESSAGKGEYGIIPPGSYTSSNMASGGKIYSVSILE